LLTLDEIEIEIHFQYREYNKRSFAATGVAKADFVAT
jgi:hypothetical protein